MQKIQSDRKSLQTLVVWIFDEKGFDMLRVDGRKQPHILEKVKYGLEWPRPITAGVSDCTCSPNTDHLIITTANHQHTYTTERTYRYAVQRKHPYQAIRYCVSHGHIENIEQLFYF